MPKYEVYIKSHTEAPDFEREIEAENIIEAFKKLIETQPGLDTIETLIYDMGRVEDSKKDKISFEDKVVQQFIDFIEIREKNYGKILEQNWKKDKLIQVLQRFIAEKGLLEEFLEFYQKGRQNKNN